MKLREAERARQRPQVGAGSRCLHGSSVERTPASANICCENSSG